MAHGQIEKGEAEFSPRVVGRLSQGDRLRELYDIGGSGSKRQEGGHHTSLYRVGRGTSISGLANTQNLAMKGIMSSTPAARCVGWLRGDRMGWQAVATSRRHPAPGQPACSRAQAHKVHIAVNMGGEGDPSTRRVEGRGPLQHTTWRGRETLGCLSIGCYVDAYYLYGTGVRTACMVLPDSHLWLPNVHSSMESNRSNLHASGTPAKSCPGTECTGNQCTTPHA